MVLQRLSPTVLVRWLTLASLVANVVIVITGGAVRLADSGLGCPTWLKCTADSYVATPAMGAHGAIEFGNRMLGGLVGVLAISATVAIWWRYRRGVEVRLAVLVLAGVLGQGLLGGVTVLTGLNPWLVAGHFGLSMAVLAAAYPLWQRVRRAGEQPPPRAALPRPVTALVGLVVAAAVPVLVLGTIVTGSGPHAGDPDAPRMGFDLQNMAQLHTDAVFFFVGLSVATWFALRAVDASANAIRAAAVLIGLEVAQGAIGLIQYALHLPVLLVGLHMAGACAVWLAVLALADQALAHQTAGRAQQPAVPAVAAAQPAQLQSTKS